MPGAVAVTVKYPTAGVKVVTLKGTAKVGVDLLTSNLARVSVTVRNSDISLRFINQGNVEIELGTGFSHPYPVIQLGIGGNLSAITRSDLRIDVKAATASLTIQGEISCQIAEIVKDRSADIKKATVVVRQVNSTGLYRRTGKSASQGFNRSIRTPPKRSRPRQGQKIALLSGSVEQSANWVAPPRMERMHRKR